MSFLRDTYTCKKHGTYEASPDKNMNIFCPACVLGAMGGDNLQAVAQEKLEELPEEEQTAAVLKEGSVVNWYLRCVNQLSTKGTDFSISFTFGKEEKSDG